MAIKKGTSLRSIFFILILLIIAAVIFINIRDKKNTSNSQNAKRENPEKSVENKTDSSSKTFWIAPEENSLSPGENQDQILYGKELIAHTSIYFGPKGKLTYISNGMNCQNCHSDAGTKPYGLNFSAVASTYPQFRNRSESIVSIAQRINSCFRRSLNGKSLDSASKEMNAMIAYIEWIGKDVPEGIKPENSSVEKLSYMDRAADPVKGKIVYATCQVCHGENGEGQINKEGTEYFFPPLWGKHSYNDGAGMYRLGNFAGFVKNNMPFGTSYKHPELTDEEAWDVAAYVNAQPRPHKDQSRDYSILTDKPIDAPYGPYADTFSEKQHKYGPFQPIADAHKKEQKSAANESFNPPD